MGSLSYAVQLSIAQKTRISTSKQGRNSYFKVICEIVISLSIVLFNGMRPCCRWTVAGAVAGSVNIYKGTLREAERREEKETTTARIETLF